VTRYDHIVVGGGHNGLVCAAYLARGGRRTLVVEAADHVGGAAMTREFAPGFRVSAGAHVLDCLPLDLMGELELERNGLQFVARGLATVALGQGRSSIVLADGGIEGVQAGDAAAYGRFSRQMRRFAGVLDRVDRMAPFRLSLGGWQERLDAARLAWAIRGLGRHDMREFLRVVGMNAYDLLTDQFDSDLLKGALGLDATLGAEHGARAPGTVLTLLQRYAGRLRAGGGAMQPAGGMGAVTGAIAQAAVRAGAVIRTGARVRRIVVESNRACAVLLESGEQIHAGSIISNADPKTTFLKLLDPDQLETDFVRRIDRFRSKGLVAKMHLALDDLPTFTALQPTRLGARMLLCPSLDALELAFNPSKYREVPERPALEVCIPTINDPGLAPAGRHVMSINLMAVPYDLGADPAAARRRLAQAVLSTLERYAPGLSERVVASELLTPADLEREFGMNGGHWHHGALAFDQFFFARPVPGAAGYATPVPGLYLCGAGSHPGGGVMGIAGRNAAFKVLKEGH